MNQTLRSIKDSLRYPLKLGSLVIIIIMSVIGALLFYSMDISLRDYGSGFARLFFIMGLLVFYPAINALFEHGLDIIESSVQGRAEPPVPGLAALKGTRFFKQLLVLIFLTATAQAVNVLGYENSANVILIIIVLALPASIANYSIVDHFFEMINPVALLRLAISLGLPYFLSILPLILIILLFREMSGASLLLIFSMMLISLYLLILFFRFLGLCVYQRLSLLREEIDFNAGKEQTIESHQASLNFNKVFLNAHELIRAGKMEDAEKLILPVVQVNNWARFDTAFAIISQWPQKKPALTVTKMYVPILIEKLHYMRVLELCAWILEQEPDYKLSQNADIITLAGQAASKEQCRIVIQLIENTPHGDSDLNLMARQLKEKMSFGLID